MPPVEYQINPIADLSGHVFGREGFRATGTVGAGRSNGAARGPAERPGDRGAAVPDPDCLSLAQQFPRHIPRCLEYEGQRARPAGVHQRIDTPGDAPDQAVEIFPVGNEHQDRFRFMAALGFVNPPYGSRIGPVRADTVYRLGGKGHQAAAADDVRGLREYPFVRPAGING